MALGAAFSVTAAKPAAFPLPVNQNGATRSNQGLGAGQADVLVGEQALIFMLLSCK